MDIETKMNYLMDAINKIKKSKKSEWDTGIHKDFLELSADAKGDVGEILVFEELFPKLGYDNITYTRCKIGKDGIYDGRINDIKIEVKTASLGKKSKTFQHENFYEGESDFHFFVSICPNYYYLTIMPEKDLFSNVHSIMGCSIHNRPSGAKKFTFSESTLLTKSIPKGFTIKIDETTNEEEIKNFVSQWSSLSLGN